MSVSIVISTFNRNPQLAATLASIRQQNFDGEVIVVDDGDLSHGNPSASFVCSAFGVQYIRVRRLASTAFRNPSYPNNVGIRAATGDVVILQNAECRHIDPKTIEKLVAHADETSAVFARVVALNEDGSPMMVYCGPENPRPYFFCGAIRREHLVRLRGFDEDYTGAGYDDDDLADRLAAIGINFFYSDAEVHHQWHAPAGEYADASEMRTLYQQKLGAMMRREIGPERNIGVTWGGQP